MMGSSLEGAGRMRVILTQDQIRRRVAELGSELSDHYRGLNPVVIPLLKGGFIFGADLVRAMAGVEMQIEFLGAQSYGSGVVSSGEVRLTLDASMPLAGRHVLMIEDIVDSGNTLAYIHRLIRSRKPASLRTVVLLDKTDARKVEVEVDWVGFSIPDRFVYGYGLDHPGGVGRNLQHIVALEGPPGDGGSEGIS
ncbi:hypoxanthine phosphoribosyltransferase [Candidatus Fermentibacterales bacterium]|nr:hypoxanthine phosphoribosyltransferase [Candidatus Fermentibacterales bacterium]